MKFNQEIPKKTGEVSAETIENSCDIKSTKFITDLISKTKEFLRSKAIDLKLGAMVIIAMGSMEVVQAQEGDVSKFGDAIENIQSGKYNTIQVIDSIYNSYKQENSDPACFVFEIANCKKDGEIQNKIDTYYSGKKLPIENRGDTISLGNVEVKNFSVDVIENKNSWEDTNSKSVNENNYKSLSLIKINDKENNDLIKKDKSYISYGETEEEAIISAIYEIVLLKKSNIFLVSNQKTKDEYNSNQENNKRKGYNNFLELSTIESHEILKNVKIVVKKMSEEEFLNHYKFPMGNIKNYYSAEVIYGE